MFRETHNFQISVFSYHPSTQRLGVALGWYLAEYQEPSRTVDHKAVLNRKEFLINLRVKHNVAPTEEQSKVSCSKHTNIVTRQARVQPHTL